MKKKFTKALSLLIAVMLVIAIMPTTFAGDTDLEPSGVKIVYNMAVEGYAAKTTMHDVTYSKTKDFWEYAGKSDESVNRIQIWPHILNSTAEGIIVLPGANHWCAIKLNVPKAGLYDLEVNRYWGKNCGGAYFYFGSAEEGTEKILAKTATGKVKSYDASYDAEATNEAKRKLEKERIGTVEVPSAGEYILIVRCFTTDEREEEGLTVDVRRQYIKEIILDGCGDAETKTPATMGALKLGEKNTVTVGNTANVSVSAYDGIEATALSTDSVIYTSFDDTVLSFNGTSATAHKPGTVTVTAASDAWTNPLTAKVVVEPDPDAYSNVTVVYDLTGYGIDIDQQDFSTTNGFWDYETRKSASDAFKSNTVLGFQVNVGLNNWWAMRLNVPSAGIYSLKMNKSTNPYGAKANVYFADATLGIDQTINENYMVGSVDFREEGTNNVTSDPEMVPVGYVDVSKPGEYIVVFKSVEKGPKGSRQYFTQVILDGCTGETENYVPMLNVTADKNVITAGETATVTATSTLMSNGKTTITPGITYTSNGVVTVDNSGNVTTNKDGVATVTATATADGKSSSRSVNITVNNKEISDAFNAVSAPEEDYIAPSVTGITVDGTAITPDKNSDGSYNLTAPETKAESAFLYWAMGMSTNKRIVSFDATLKNYVPEGNGVNYLVPVYADDVSEDVYEYYNLNGQRIAALPVGEDAPELPEIPGLGGAKCWKRCAENVYVAEYESETAYDKVTVNGEEVAYGTKIECKADKDARTFRFWKKTVNGTEEVVSLDPEYTFYAWEDTTVTAEYGDNAPMFTGDRLRIIIGSFDVGNNTGVMAEFIGLENAVEKGIMFTAKSETKARKMAMTTTDNQFTVIANESGTYEGYAIVGSEEEGFTLITDGIYTKE